MDRSRLPGSYPIEAPWSGLQFLVGYRRPKRCRPQLPPTVPIGTLGAIFGLCDVLAIAMPSRQPAGCLAFLPLPHHPNFFKILLISNHYIAIMILGGRKESKFRPWYQIGTNYRLHPFGPCGPNLPERGNFPPLDTPLLPGGVPPPRPTRALQHAQNQCYCIRFSNTLQRRFGS